MADVDKKPANLRRWNIVVIGATVALITLSASLSWRHYTKLRDERIALTLTNGERVLQALRDHTMRLLDYSDSYIRSVRSYYLQNGDKFSMAQYLQEIKIEHASSFQGILAIGNSDGDIIFNSENLSIQNLGSAKPPYFEYFRNHPQDGVYIDPTRRGQVSGKMLFRLVRPIIKNGAFDSFVLMGIRPEHFTMLFEGFDLGPHSFTAMFTLDHRLIARQPSPPDEYYNRPLDNIDLWQHLKNSKSGSYTARSQIDGIERYVLYTRLPDYPIVIDIGISRDNIIDTLRDTKFYILTQEILFSVSSVIFAALIMLILQKNSKLTLAEQIIRALANTDPLTGLKNRRHFFEVAAREFTRAERYDLPLAVMMIDADHFKSINDTFGHATGDVALCQMVKKVSEVLRETDVFGRLGGEEFAILLPQTTIGGATVLAERVRENIAAMTIDTDKGPLRLTVSIGVDARSNRTPSFATMLHDADSAMYRAKEAGRNRVMPA
ncbi:sensor domain-containing diguanylate cyclase [Telmatospirillum siberiense]|uniref:diguanylate cyclase n=1 Tax=Telmatospirillum siberiense TaxID=382514 RepID=A0A2N3Q154_9PROT|nr:diguanylate cyclase [Telmatospirillum siberiense]PKU26384.1 hypothetical protein CWS72_00590 [Telmatospirillum siberiense]